MRTFMRSYKSLSATLDLKAIRAIQSNSKTIKKKAEPPQWTFYLPPYQETEPPQRQRFPQRLVKKQLRI